MKVQDVFTPNGYPEHTYVERERENLEKDLKNSLRMKGSVVELSGPSKAGKTMLVRKLKEDGFIGELAEIKGSNIDSKSDLWNLAMDDLGLPTSKSRQETTREEKGEKGKAGISAGPVQVGGEAHSTSSDAVTKSESHSRRGVRDIINFVDLDNFVLLIDDFHYIDEDLQPAVAESIKGAAEKGISVCVAVVGYRSENLEKVNPDLAGRVKRIELDYWDDEDLKKIAKKGFDRHLNINLEERIIDSLVQESAGSPQLMQLLCFALCISADIYEPSDTTRELEVGKEKGRRLFTEAIDWAGFESVVETIDQGKETRGEGRKLYKLDNNGEGDYYRVCLKAIAENPPQFSFHRNDLFERVKQVCVDDHPAKNQITNFCENMIELVEDKRPKADFVEWDEEEDYLHISEPGFLFTIRWTVRLDMLE